MIIGISGKAESGKDTAANMLKILYGNPNISYEDYNNKNYNKFADIEVIHFADILKETAMTMCVLSEEDVCTQHGKKRKIEWLGITVRELLQKLGTCIRQNIDEDFWVKSLWAVVDNWNLLEYPLKNEYEAGSLVEVYLLLELLKKSSVKL